MRALVTGCAGFIGSHLTESLLGDGCSVLGVDCFNDNYGRAQKLCNLEQSRDWEAFEFVPIDLSRGDLDDLVEQCDVIFHLAAEPGVRPSWGRRFESYLRNNVAATQHLLEATRTVPGVRVVYASSSSVYGQAERLPTPEDTVPAPYSPYGITKLSGEHLCRVYEANYGVDVVCLRYFSVYGPRQRPDMAFHRFCTAALQRRPIEIYGVGTQTRDFTYVLDVVAATRAAGEAPGATGLVANIGGGAVVSVNDTLVLLQDIVGRAVEVDRRPVERGDVRDTGAEIVVARERLGYAPAVRLPEGLAAEWEWVLERDRRLTV